MNLDVISGIILSTRVFSFGIEIVPAKIHVVELALVMLLFVPLWFVNLCVLNAILSFILSIGVWLFSTLEHNIPKRFTALLAVIPTIFELHWISTKVGIGVGYWGAFSW